jgi:hypothetical protein
MPEVCARLRSNLGLFEQSGKHFIFFEKNIHLNCPDFEEHS